MAEVSSGIGPLDLSGNMAENWKFWLQKFTNYIKAKELDKKSEGLRCSLLLHFIGDEPLRIYNTFTFTEEEKEKLEPLIVKFTEYFNPRKNLTYERNKLIKMTQSEGESIQHFVTALKNQAKNCEWGGSEEIFVCTVLIGGLLDQELQQRLLEDDKINVSKAIKICLSVEESKKQAREMSEGKEVCAVRATQSVPGRYTSPLHKQRSTAPRSSWSSNQQQPGPSQGVPATSSGGWSRRTPQPQQKGNCCYRCG